MDRVDSMSNPDDIFLSYFGSRIPLSGIDEPTISRRSNRKSLHFSKNGNQHPPPITPCWKNHDLIPHRANILNPPSTLPTFDRPHHSRALPSIRNLYPLHKGETFISGNRNIIRCVPLKKRCKLFSLNKS